MTETLERVKDAMHKHHSTCVLLTADGRVLESSLSGVMPWGTVRSLSRRGTCAIHRQSNAHWYVPDGKALPRYEPAPRGL